MAKDPNKLATDWKDFSIKTFIRLQDKTQFAAFAEKLPAFSTTKYTSEKKEATNELIADYKFLPQPFDNFHFDGFSDIGIAAGGKMINIKRLGWIGLLILLVACFNFMNLSNAKSSQRLKEVGVRKVLGARKFQLKKQFIVEAILVSFLALILAVLLMDYSLPYIENLTDYALQIDW